MATYFDEIKTIILSVGAKSTKINKLVNDMNCTRDEAERYYAIIKHVEGTPQNIARARFTIGVEIECFDVNRSIIGEVLNSKNIKNVTTGYDHTDYNDTYKLADDCSINGNNACEIVSPVLKNLNSLKIVCESLNESGAKVNRSCGLHVHFGAEKFTTEHWLRIVRNYANIEPVIDSFMPESRRGDNNRYCKSIARYDFSNVATIGNLRDALQCDRYHKINVEAYARHKTIEFRQHSGTTDFEKISMWVSFLEKLINYSINHQELITADNIDQLPFLTVTQKKYYKTRQQYFNL